MVVQGWFKVIIAGQVSGGGQGKLMAGGANRNLSTFFAFPSLELLTHAAQQESLPEDKYINT